jgi:hypothetical protein
MSNRFARALNLSIFTLPMVMAAGAFLGAPRLPVAAPPAPALSCAAPAPAPIPVRPARLADLAEDGCRETLALGR